MNGISLLLDFEIAFNIFHFANEYYLEMEILTS